MKIPSFPENVCAAHALEFWTGLLAYATDLDAVVMDGRACGVESSEHDTTRRRAQQLRLAS